MRGAGLPCAARAAGAGVACACVDDAVETATRSREPISDLLLMLNPNPTVRPYQLRATIVALHHQSRQP